MIYLTVLNPQFYPRPLFFAKCCGVRTYRLRTFLGHYLNPNKEFSSASRGDGGSKQNKKTLGDPLFNRIYKCKRQNNTILLDSLLYELLYLPYIEKIDDDFIVLNPHAVVAGRATGRKVVLDLMDLYFCRDNPPQINAFDIYAMRKADMVLAWSRAIYSYLKTLGIRHVEYLPFGVDLDIFDPLRVDPKIVYEKYPELEGKTVIGYSGGVWMVNGRDVLGVEKIFQAFKIVEKRVPNVVLAVQSNPLVKNFAKMYEIKKFVYVEQTKNFNDPLRQAFLRIIDIKILPGSKYPAVNLAERTTAYQYMASGGAIVAENTLGNRGLFVNGKDAMLVELGDVLGIANAIITLVEKPELREDLGKTAREELEKNYTWSVLSRKAKTLIEKLTV